MSQKPTDWTSGQYISLFLFGISGSMACFVFFLSRNDHDMKLLALGSVLGFIAGSSGTASAILVGKPNHPQSNMPDVPLGGSAVSIESVQSAPGKSED